MRQAFELIEKFIGLIIFISTKRETCRETTLPLGLHVKNSLCCETWYLFAFFRLRKKRDYKKFIRVDNHKLCCWITEEGNLFSFIFKHEQENCENSFIFLFQ